MITLLLVDDQIKVRRGLRMRLMLEPGILVVGEASDGGEALEQVRILSPDVVLMDVQMPSMDGIAATVALQSNTPRSAVVMLSLYGDTQTRAQEADAVAFVEKRGTTQKLLAAIRQAVQQ